LALGLSDVPGRFREVQRHRATVDRVEVPHPREYLVAFGIIEAAWMPILLVPQRVTPEMTANAILIAVGISEMASELRFSPKFPPLREV
jgi:hypothetical protein